VVVVLLREPLRSVTTYLLTYVLRGVQWFPFCWMALCVFLLKTETRVEWWSSVNAPTSSYVSLWLSARPRTHCRCHRRG